MMILTTTAIITTASSAITAEENQSWFAYPITKFGPYFVGGFVLTSISTWMAAYGERVQPCF